VGTADRAIRGVRRAALLAALLGFLFAERAAAADLTVQGTCFASGQQIVLTGTTFTPLAAVTIGGDVAATSAQADAAGTFRVAIAAPAVAELGPRTVTVTAVDAANPTNAATLRLSVVRAAFGSNLPIAGRPDDRTTWRFAGFAPARPIYAHFRLGGRTRGDFRFGVAHGVCGTLTAHAPRIPGVRALRPGRWTLKLDQRPTYHARTPGRAVRFRVAARR
jgi:hypothetical protein